MRRRYTREKEPPANIQDTLVQLISGLVWIAFAFFMYALLHHKR